MGDPANLPLDRLLNLGWWLLYTQQDEQARWRIDESLQPPHRIDPSTGMPYSWDGDDDWEHLLP